MTDTPLWALSATEIARATTQGEITAEAATAAAVARMRAANPALNAVVRDLGEAALARARALDLQRAAGRPCGALHGVPVTIKVNVDQADEATTNGLPALKDAVATEDAPLVANLLAAGAVVIGRTNTPEFSFRVETDNPLYGRTKNPWGDHVSSGGSSGGAGSAVAAGIGALAHGNDIAGSLRYPAAATGTVTVKPGLGRVPAWNPSQKAERGMLAQAMSVQGLIARHAADLHLAMPAMIAPDPRDPFHVPMPWAGPEAPREVAVVRGAELHPEVALAMQAAEEALRDAGYRISAAVPPSLAEATRTGLRALFGETLALMGADIARLGSATMNAIFAEYHRAFPPFAGDDLLRAMALRSRLARDWTGFLAETPLVLTPFLPRPFYRPLRDTEGAEGLAEVMGAAEWCTGLNFMGLPAGLVPVRLAETAEGPVPVGVQIIGRRWREDLIVIACEAVEARLGRPTDRLLARG